MRKFHFISHVFTTWITKISQSCLFQIWEQKCVRSLTQQNFFISLYCVCKLPDLADIKPRRDTRNKETHFLITFFRIATHYSSSSSAPSVIKKFQARLLYIHLQEAIEKRLIALLYLIIRFSLPFFSLLNEGKVPPPLFLSARGTFNQIDGFYILFL